MRCLSVEVAEWYNVCKGVGNMVFDFKKWFLAEFVCVPHLSFLF